VRPAINYVELGKSLPDQDSLEERLEVSFNDKKLLTQALVHSSFLNENPGVFTESNERLEFLGDAIIGSAIAAELFLAYDSWPEGMLTSGRSSLVQGDTLARVAGRIGMGEYLQMGRGEEAAGGRNRSNNLAATFEAVVGAHFLDRGYDAAADLVLRLLEPELSELTEPGASPNPKSSLQEAIQARGQSAPFYRIVKVEGQDHARRFTAEVVVDGEPIGTGTGSRKSLAERAAADDALKGMTGGG
jgi:ribonuclease-3